MGNRGLSGRGYTDANMENQFACNTAALRCRAAVGCFTEYSGRIMAYCSGINDLYTGFQYCLGNLFL